MANLVSGGVSVTITDESFFIPAAATTVPLIFIATAAEKSQAGTSGVAALPAVGTYESNVIRSVTSLKQSGELYGAPRFLRTEAGQSLHGDARNEYGLMALNQFLGVGSLAYVIRADVNLNDELTDVRLLWDTKIENASTVLEGLVTEFIGQYNKTNGFGSGDAGYKATVTKTELIALVNSATSSIWDLSTFLQSKTAFMDDHTASPYKVYANGYQSASTGTFVGFTGAAAAWSSAGSGSVVPANWTPMEAGNMLVAVADLFKFTTQFRAQTSLGANDAARRVAITTALQAAIGSNTDIRSDKYEYNLIVCPGYPEVDDALINLCIDIKEEAFVIGNTPFDVSPDDMTNWATSSVRQKSSNIAYYYPNGLAAEAFSGRDVFCSAAGTALRTIAYSDNISNVWMAPAGTRRGLVSGTTTVGYLTGQLGSPTTFVEVALNQGQRDMLYQYFTNINPITFFPGRGLLVWGQKTSAPDASALDRINVSRLLMYIRRQLRKNSMAFVYEPNDALTRDNLKAMVDGFLSDLIVKRALYDYVTICDGSNNTPDRIDRNELYIDIALKPVKAAEFIYIPIRVLSTGAQMP